MEKIKLEFTQPVIEIAGHDFTLKAPTKALFEKVQALKKAGWLKDAVELVLDGPIDKLNFDELDIRIQGEAVALFLDQVTPTGGEQLRSLVGLKATAKARN